MITARQQKGRAATVGRPVTIGGDRYIGIRLPSDLLDRIDAHAKTAEIGRSEFIRTLLELGLATRLRRGVRVKPPAVKRGGRGGTKGAR
jgi:hypothetical protein